MNTRKLLALGTVLTFTSLAGVAFAADQKAAAPEKAPAPAATAPAAATAQAPTGDQTAPATHSKKKQKHQKKPAAAPETKG
jgi:hypothetical protein